VVWQPHTYSRVRLLCSAFAAAFSDADHVVVTGVYAARETRPPGFSLAGLLEAMEHPDARQIDEFGGVVADVSARIEPDSVLLVFSAGDANRISAAVLNHLKT
jgi:UDP-N-acetylmuramate--alanine ligase